MWGHRACTAFGAAMLLLSSVAAQAADGISIELNKAEMSGDQCNMYFMLQNKTGRQLENYKLDLVLFDPDGVIAKQLAVETAPLAPGKTVVKAFPVKEMACDGISRLLLNNVTLCVDDQGAREGCTAETDVSTRTGIEFIK